MMVVVLAISARAAQKCTRSRLRRAAPPFRDRVHLEYGEGGTPPPPYTLSSDLQICSDPYCFVAISTACLPANH